MSQPITLKPALSINEIDAKDWQDLLSAGDSADADHPFVQHAFLKALEDSASVGAESGWQPCHLAFYRDDKLVAVMPNYIKGHSYGEYVFDWTWADAFQRNGLEYYPKALTAVPMTPVTGPRLISSLQSLERAALIQAAVQWSEQNHLSSWHVNFITPEEYSDFSCEQMLERWDIQFHWHNQEYGSFDDFLSHLKAKKRKNILRERRPFLEDESEQGWQFCWLNGHTASTEDWQLFYRMYRNTFDRKGGWAQLSVRFFEQCARAMPEQTLLLLAKYRGKVIAGAFFMRSQDALFGRYWGCTEEVEFLHFETCYYRGIEYAIKHGLKRFEPGAQGEHKLARGFLPVKTHSRHYVFHPEFRAAIAGALQEEDRWLQLRWKDYFDHSPYKS
ncbi:GNAT family N-acetyltransferase [Kangiella shandongensis]|uniref:GNAT family N-acetyltransferase n=1 Tax=Kangiella shandongensis TaxID=2763258 RepID=UPI001CBACFAC|nr:GNAT family N-acetyltransferase [Kangiella shandongensis]